MTEMMFERFPVARVYLASSSLLALLARDVEVILTPSCMLH
jgi:hypothetical protein